MELSDRMYDEAKMLIEMFITSKATLNNRNNKPAWEIRKKLDLQTTKRCKFTEIDFLSITHYGAQTK